MNRVFKIMVMVFFMIIIDQVTKGYFQHNYQLGQSTPIIDGFFNFTYVQNRGAAFGFGATYGDWFRISLFKVFPIFIVIGLLVSIWKERNNDKKALASWSYGLIVAGAVGNLFDRIGLDYVVDFLDFYWGKHHYPAFNIADSCITTAVILLLIEMVIEAKEEQAQKKLENQPGQNTVETDTAETSGD